MKTRKIIYADEGKVITNGKVYGKIVYLADGDNGEDFYEITDEEYAAIMAEKEKESRAEWQNE
jgi:hypothetical protein